MAVLFDDIGELRLPGTDVVVVIAGVVSNVLLAVAVIDNFAVDNALTLTSVLVNMLDGTSVNKGNIVDAGGDSNDILAIVEVDIVVVTTAVTTVVIGIVVVIDPTEHAGFDSQIHLRAQTVDDRS